MLDLTIDRGVIHVEATRDHHLFQIAVAQGIA